MSTGAFRCDRDPPSHPDIALGRRGGGTAGGCPAGSGARITLVALPLDLRMRGSERSESGPVPLYRVRLLRDPKSKTSATPPIPMGEGQGYWTPPPPKGCIRREGTSEAAAEAVRPAFGGGCRSGWGRLLSVTNAIEVGTCRQGDGGWAWAGRPGGGGAGTPHPSNASLPPPPPSTLPNAAMAYRCVCTTGTVQNKAEVQSKSRRKKLFSDMSWAPFAVVNKMAWSPQVFTTPKVLQSVNLADGRWQKVPLNVRTMLQTSNSSSPPRPVDVVPNAPPPPARCRLRAGPSTSLWNGG